MKNKKAPIFTLTIVAIIVGVALYRQFDFQTQTFEKPALAIVYAVTFVFSLTVIARHYFRKQQ